MSFEMNSSWLNLTNPSILNETEDRFNFKATTEDFFTREGERFVREDPLVPFSNSVLTEITQDQNQSWSNDQEIDNPACSTTAFFMAKSSTPDEMLNVLLTGKPENISTKENQSMNSSKTLTNEWTELSLSNKKSISALNLRQQKKSPLLGNSNTIVKKPKTVLTSAQALRGEVSRSLFDRKPKSTSTSVNCDLLDSTIHSHDGRRRHSLDLSDTTGSDVSTVNTETQTSQLAGSSSSSSSSTGCSRGQIHRQPPTIQNSMPPSTGALLAPVPFPTWPTPAHHTPQLFYPVVSYHPIYSYQPSKSTNLQYPPGPLCIHPPPTTISNSSDIYSHHHESNSPIITSLHSQPSDEKSSTSSFQRTSRSSSSSLLSSNSQRLSQHHLSEQHEHWWLDIPSSTIFRFPSCFAHQTNSIDVPIKNNGSVDITLSVHIHKWDLISDSGSVSVEAQQSTAFRSDKTEYLIKSQQEISIKIHFCPFQTGNYQCKLNLKCQFCPQHQAPSSNSLVTLVGVCHDVRNEAPILLSSTRDHQRMVDEHLVNRSSAQSQVSDFSLTSTTAQSDGDLTSISQHRQKDAVLDVANQIGIEQNNLDFGVVSLTDDSTINSKTLKITIKNYSRTEPCDVDISEAHLPFCISVRRATIREKSFVKLTCRFRPKKIGYYSENVVLTVRRRNYFKTAITLTGRCVVNNLSSNVNETIEHDENTKSTIF